MRAVRPRNVCVNVYVVWQGYTIPLDKRLAADGRGLQETAINDNFAKFTEALYVAEQSARRVRPNLTYNLI